MERISATLHHFLTGLAAAFALITVLPQHTSAAPTEEGLFATFSITRDGQALGEFTCRLEFERTPQTVANFVGLAEGTQTWIDFSDGSISKQRFYDGITFHRVEPGFVVQTGSPGGARNGNPGYTIGDEIVGDLSHDKAGVLSMANTGANSNGSQFFITLNAITSLNGLHTIFGEVVEGLEFLNTIQVNDVIESVTIIRNGAAAESFDPGAHGLPVVHPLAASISRKESATTLDFDSADAQIFTFESGDLETWNKLGGTIFSTTAEPVDQVDVTPDESARQAFFKQIEVAYPTPLFTPSTVTGLRLSLADITNVTFSLDFTEIATGTYTLDTGSTILGPFPINDYTWVQDAFRGRLVGNVYNLNGLTLNNLIVAEADVSLIFSTPDSGEFRGHLITEDTPPRRIPLQGTFTLAPL